MRPRGDRQEATTKNSRRADAETASARGVFTRVKIAARGLESGGDQPAIRSVHTRHVLRESPYGRSRVGRHASPNAAGEAARRDFRNMSGDLCADYDFNQASVPPAHVWFEFCLFAMPGMLAIIFVRPPRLQPGHCKTCGYNLTGNVSGKCSECGAPVPAP